MKPASSINKIIALAFKGVGMAMAIATTVINILKAAPLETQMLLIAIGLACLAIISLDQEKDEE